MEKKLFSQLLWFSLLFLFLFTGCKSFVKLRYGVTNPKVETTESLTKFLKKHHYPVESFYVFKDSTSYLKILKDPVLKHTLFTTIIINEDFKKIATDSSRCQWSGGYFVEH
jgi:hypothetical protein